MSKIIDQDATFTLMEERLARTTDPRHREMLERLLVHARGEAAADLDAVMSTLAPQPIYRSYASMDPLDNPEGTQAVHDFYTNRVFGHGQFYFQFDMDRIIMDDDAIATEGNFRSILWGRDAAPGYPIDDVDAFYILKVRMIIIWPYDENCMVIGEQAYAHVTTPDFLTKIDYADLPEKYVAYVERRREAMHENA